MKTYAWDFGGPRAQVIARHHAQHVREFLAREKLEGCEVGIEVTSPTRAIAWCRASDEAQPVLERALRPPRVLE